MNLTAEVIMKMREETGLGMQECASILKGELMMQRIEYATTLEDIKPLLRELVRLNYKQR